MCVFGVSPILMRHWRAFQNGTAKTHAAEDVANHKRKLAAEKQEEKEQKKMAQKLKKEAIEFGESNSAVAIRDFMVKVINLSLGHGFPARISNC